MAREHPRPTRIEHARYGCHVVRSTSTANACLTPSSDRSSLLTAGRSHSATGASYGTSGRVRLNATPSHFSDSPVPAAILPSGSGSSPQGAR